MYFMARQRNLVGKLLSWRPIVRASATKLLFTCELGLWRRVTGLKGGGEKHFCRLLGAQKLMTYHAMPGKMAAPSPPQGEKEAHLTIHQKQLLNRRLTNL